MTPEDLAKRRDEFKTLSSAFLPAAIVLSAIELDIFTALAAGPADPATLAAKIGVDTRALEVLLSSLASLGYVEGKAGSYENSALAATYLARGSALYEGDSAQMSLWFMRLANGLSDVVRKGSAADTMEAGVARDPRIGQMIVRSMDQIAPDFIPALLQHLTVAPGQRILDVGGAAGTFAHALASSADGASATVFELPNAAGEARAIVAERGWKNVDVVEGDFRKDPLGGPWDVIFVSNVLHLLEAEAAAALIQRMAGALAPKGRLVIKEMVGQESGASPAGLAAYAVLMMLVSRGGRLHPETAYARWCEGAGLSRPERIDCWARSSLLIASRP